MYRADFGQTKEQIKVFGVANSYLKHRHVNQFIYWLKTYFEMEPGTTD